MSNATKVFSCNSKHYNTQRPIMMNLRSQGGGRGMSNDPNDNRKRLRSHPSGGSPPPSPTSQQPPKFRRTGGKTVPTGPMTRSCTRRRADTTAVAGPAAWSSGRAARPTACAAARSTGPVTRSTTSHAVATVTVTSPSAAVSAIPEFIYVSSSDSEGHGGDNAEDGEDEREEEEEMEDEDSSRGNNDSTDNNEDDDSSSYSEDDDSNDYSEDDDFNNYSEDDDYADDEASTEGSSSQGSSNQGSSGQRRSNQRSLNQGDSSQGRIAEEEEEEPDVAELELLDTANEYYRQIGDFDRDNSDMGGPGSAGSNSSSNNSYHSGGNYCGSNVTSASSSTSSGRSRYTSGLAGGGGHRWNRPSQAPPPRVMPTKPIRLDCDEDARILYHPEHPVVRMRINDMYRVLAHNETASPGQTLPSQPIVALCQALSTASRSLNTVSDLMDVLIRTHLPQFWVYRAKDRVLNQDTRRPCKNSRYRGGAVMTTCVECGFRFCKNPIYIAPASERYRDNAMRAERKKKEGPSANGSRGPHKERKFTAAGLWGRLLSEQYPESNTDIANSEDFHKDDDYRPHLTHYRNSHLSPVDIDDIFNNNRKDKAFDGNIDHLGMKEEGHGWNCLTNFNSTSSRATKLHFGWDLVVGFRHSYVPKFPDPQRVIAPMPPTPHQLRPFSVAQPGKQASAPSQHQQPRPQPDSYYPSRSLLAAFHHLLPRGLELTDIEIRKLFTYFVWHPWFDCDFQAITIRKAYAELWPLFLLRNEDEEVGEEELEEERERLAKMLKKKADEAKAKKKANGRTVQKGRKRQTQTASPAQPLTPAEIEYERQTQMEIRFQTSFERALTNHGVVIESRRRTMDEYARVVRQVRKGWVLGPRFLQYQSSTSSFSITTPSITHLGKDPIYPGTMHTFYVHHSNPIANSPTVSFPQTEIPRFQNTAWTRPDRMDALDHLGHEVEGWWAEDAASQRENLGFTLPEFARIRNWTTGEVKMVDGSLVYVKGKDEKKGGGGGKRRRRQRRGGGGRGGVTGGATTRQAAGNTQATKSKSTSTKSTNTSKTSSRTPSRRTTSAGTHADISPMSSTADRPFAGTGRITRASAAAARRASSQGQAQDMGMDVDTASVSTSRSPLHSPITQSGRGQHHHQQSQPEQQFQPQPQPQQYQTQAPFTAESPSSTSTDLNTFVRPPSTATISPSTDFNTVAGPMMMSAIPPPITAINNSHALSAENFISDLTSPMANACWENQGQMVQQMVSSDRVLPANVNNSSTAHQTFSIAAIAQSQALCSTASLLPHAAHAAEATLSSIAPQPNPESVVAMAANSHAPTALVAPVTHTAAVVVPGVHSDFNADMVMDWDCDEDIETYFDFTAMAGGDSAQNTEQAMLSALAAISNVNGLGQGLARMAFTDRSRRGDPFFGAPAPPTVPEESEEATKLTATQLEFENQGGGGGQNGW